jgi:hypothetical protein
MNCPIATITKVYKTFLKGLSLNLLSHAATCIVHISEHRIGDTTYFEKLTKAINSIEVKRAFYEDMMDRFESLSNWSEDVIPDSESRKTKIIEALPCIYKFIKEEYILKSFDLNMKTNDFLEFYKEKSKDKTSVNKIGRLLAKLEIKPVKMSNNAGYKYIKTSKELLDTFQKLNFMDDTVDHINNDDDCNHDNIYKTKYEEAMKRIQELEKQLKCQCVKEEAEEEAVNDLDVIVDIMLN